MLNLLAIAGTVLLAPQITGDAKLICDKNSISSNSSIRLAVLFEPKKGWHSYWKNPGDSGGPTRIKLKLPAGWTQGEPEFPAPRRLDLSGVISYGYEGSFAVIVPVKVGRVDKSSYTITGRASWLTCTSEICKPADQDVKITLRKGMERSSGHFALFEKATNRLPKPVNAAITAISKSDGITLSILNAPEFGASKKIYFFPDQPGLVDHSKPQTYTRSGNSMQSFLPASPFAQARPKRLTGVFEFDGKDTNAVSVDVRILSE